MSESTTGQQFDPTTATVAQVQKHLETADDAERQRVLDAERSGQNRRGVLGDGGAAQADADAGRTETPHATTFQDAAEVGFIGESPERERTGAPDKGLSQANPAVMNQGGPVPDARPSVDDSEAIQALKG